MSEKNKITREQLEAAIGKEPSGLVHSNGESVLKIFEIHNDRVYHRYNTVGNDVPVNYALENWKLAEPEKPKRELAVIDVSGENGALLEQQLGNHFINALIPLTPEIIKEVLEGQE